MSVRIGAPRHGEAAEISALALRSKAHWGYDEAFLEACRDELTYTEDDCRSGDVIVARGDTELIGFAVVRGLGQEGELSALFVDPPRIGTGVGGALLMCAIELARGRGMTRLVIDADPGAEPFYRHAGARRIGRVPSGSIPGRFLPQLELRLDS
ncbi:GNAT family N-acetyltransferase [Microbacterium elymi]|uniref:GNAT family N-acetyltransferase n=1 Tax=Microbacterium elymi TaxID=2909587 RepID=A0ABY5NK59_9MICO|nr:GNAT family N-acetyltransferase [Microbacterium elymi]UUT35550.1 GNAT family N-acetyltransferase [Microbacterium elymi]